MRAFAATAASLAALVLPAVAQYQIWDVVRIMSSRYMLLLITCCQYTTTWDRKSLFTYTNLGPNPVNFGGVGAIGQADIVINDNQGYQSIWGHGGSLSAFIPAAFLLSDGC